MAVVLALCASAMFGVADFLGGSSSRRTRATITSFVSQFSGLILLAVAAVLAGGVIGGPDLAIGAASGFIGAAALWTFYRGLSIAAMSVVAPISAVTSAVVPIVAGLALGETLTPTDWVGISVALPAVVLISREGTSDPAEIGGEPVVEQATRASNRTGAMAGLMAGVGFGTFVVLITRTGAETGLWPLVASRSIASLVLFVAVATTGLLHKVRRGPGIGLALGAGVLDATSNVLMLEAGRRGLLTLVGLIIALYPASTVVLARVVLHERLQRHQLLGLGLAATAVALVAL